MMSATLLVLLGFLVIFFFGTWVGLALMRGRVAREARRAVELREDQVLDALDHVLRGEPDQAYEILSELAKEGDAPVSVYFALASLLRAQNRVDRTAQVYRTILARPSLTREAGEKARIGLAQALVALGRGEEAKRLIDALPRRVRSEVGLLALEGEAALQRGDWDGALSAGQALAKAEGGNGEARADVYNQVAEQAAGRGDAEAAFRGFKKALKVDPASVRAQYGLARLYQLEGKTAKARRQLVSTIQSNPSLFPVLLPELRRLLRAEGGDEETRFRELLIELGDHEGVGLWVGLERADRLFAGDRLDEAQGMLEGLVETYPRSVEVHEAYLNLLLELEDQKGLQREIERFIDLAAEEIRRFRCQRCGFLSAAAFLECPSCRTVGAVQYQAL
jgi:lipopolysaccharide assembly protein B